MAQQVILQCMDGREFDGVLAAPFRTVNNHIEVILPAEGNARKTFTFKELCCVFIKGSPDITKFSKLENAEEVETVLGESYQVFVPTKTDQKGFFGIPARKNSPFKMIYFTANGVRNRRVGSQLGEILKEKGYVSDSGIEQALKEQEKLRKRRVGEIIAEKHNFPQDVVETTIQDARKPNGPGKHVRVGEILIAAGLVTRDQVEDALANQESGKKKKIGALLIEKGFITEDQLLLALSTKFRMRFIDLKDVVPNQTALNAISLDLITRLKIFPIEADDRHIVVATSEPTDHTISETLRFNTNRDIELVSATSDQISEAIEKYYQGTDDGLNLLLDDLDEEEIEAVEEEIDVSSVNEKDSQVIKFVNGILLEAYQKGASDIHLEPKPGVGPVQVRYRVDGECRIVHQIPKNYKRAIISRIKIMSNLDISERRRPQSGKISLRTGKRKVEYRVEVTPTVGEQEDAVLRVLSSSKPLSLNEMGFSEKNLSNFKDIISKPYGIILCVGPTGSGKTTSLHSALSYLNKPDRKIWTAEDPVEITQEGLRQVQVNPKIGFNFQEALRSFLRADPDVVMIGEMRDTETAKIAIEASLTGHLVFSTLHTNSAPETAVRLIEMGMDPFNFADALLGILAQRLARRFCDHCKEAYHPDVRVYEEIVQAYGQEQFKKDNQEEYSDHFTLMKRVGCPECNRDGYSDRIAIHELLMGTENIKVAIKQNTPLEQLRNIAIEDGMRTLRMDGIEKVLKGYTDMDQIYKVSM